MDGEEEINTDDDFKGWSFRPHQKPTRVLLYFTCILYYACTIIIHRLVRAQIHVVVCLLHFFLHECLITITATPGDDTVKELNYHVTLRGIKSCRY